MKSKHYRVIEFFLLFILFPISLVLPYLIWIKIALGFIGFIYVFWVLLRVEKHQLFSRSIIQWKPFWKRVSIIFTVIAITTALYVWWMAPQHLFIVPIQKPGLYIFILFVYSFLSVWPQEVLYRTFFFKRYSDLFNSTSLLVFINAIVFCLGHLFFRNTLVLVLTFIGGILFALTYVKFKSTTLITIEHALYGNWLFTVGMGQMLGFPGIEN